MRKTHILHRRQEHSISDIVDSIYNGALDFSKKEKVFYSFLTMLVLYLSIESSNFYTRIGGAGTKYLPLGHFDEKFGGLAAFLCNSALNFWFMGDTIKDGRNVYYKYKMAKKLGITISYRKIAIELGVAILFAAATGLMFDLISKDPDSKNSLYSEIIIGGVYILLNYIGTIAFINYIKNKFFQYDDHKADTEIDNSQEILPSTEWIKENLENKTNLLKTLSNDSKQWIILKNAKGYQNFLQSFDASSVLLNKANHKSTNTIETVFSRVLHISLQVFDKIALYGYLMDTIKKTGIKNVFIRYPIGIGIFFPFGVVSFKLVYDTTTNIFELTKTAGRDIIQFIKNPEWSQKTFIKLSIIIPATALTLLGYFIAYISSNTSLELNAKADWSWNDWWNVYPTCIGSMAFNGWGFLGIMMTITNHLFKQIFYSAEKKQALHRHDQMNSFFYSFPNAIEEIAETQPMFELLSPSHYP